MIWASLVNQLTIKSHHQHAADMKECLTCRELKPRDDFPRKRSGHIGNYCAECSGTGATWGRNCEHCGAAFTFSRTLKRFCSDACRVAHSHGSALPSERTCPVCDTTFFSNLPNKKYCSPKCSEKVQRQAQNEKRMRDREAAKWARPWAAPKPCTICGNTFMPARANQVMCSKACSDRSTVLYKRAARLKANPKVEKECVVCRTKFLAYNKLQSHCSKKCTRVTDNMNKRERMRKLREEAKCK